MSGGTKARLVAIGLVVAMAPALAHAQQTPAARAQELNKQGKELFADERYLQASKKFEQAIVLSPEARFYFNLCFTLNFLERYQEALNQCHAVANNGADDELLDKTNKLIVELEKRVPTDDPGNDPGNDPGPGIDPDDPNNDPGNPGTDPSIPPPNNGNDLGPVPQGPANPFLTRTATTHPYKWSLGAELGPMSNISMGGDTQIYQDSGFHLRLFGNFILNDKLAFGIQPYFGYSAIAPVEGIPINDLRMYDFGGAVFLHRNLVADRLYYTPLLGASLSFQDPTGAPEDLFLGLGLRAEVSFAYALGSRGQHLLSLTPGLNLYTPSTASSDSIADPEMFGLDQGGATFSVSFGYTLRFSTPFGSKPLISLE